ncbi:MAG: dihydrofolate reductase family protein [Acidobacteriaceae bacterium]
MAKLIVAMNQSLDGYVDHMKFAPSPELFQHFVEHLSIVSGTVYGRGLYEVMRYWEEDQPGWEARQHDFAAWWRKQPKWVVSRSLKSVGPNTTLISTDVEATLRKLKSELPGEIDIGGTILVHSLIDTDLIDEYRIYLHPVVTGGGKPFFPGPRPSLHLAATDRITDEVIRLTYVPT